MGMAYLLGNWPTIARRPESRGDGETADLYQACLIFHFRLIARRRLATSDQSLSDRGTQWVWPFSDMTGVIILKKN